jgi:hypothetical protein
MSLRVKYVYLRGQRFKQLQHPCSLESLVELLSLIVALLLVGLVLNEKFLLFMSVEFE